MIGGFLLVAEAGPEVGLGHLAEMRAVSVALAERGIGAPCLAVPMAPPGARDVESVPDYETVMTRVMASRPRAIAWSVRTTEWRTWWSLLEGAMTRHLWMADAPGSCPPVDALVLPTLEAPAVIGAQPPGRVYLGPAYFPLDTRDARDRHQLRVRPRDVLLTMGGADRTRASLRIVPALAGTRSTVVVGPEFSGRAELLQAAAAAGIESVVAPDGLRGLLLDHRLVISAGGNTLFEAAAAGTPALVAWEDPHEEVQGAAFAARGSAHVLGCGREIDIDALAQRVTALLASDVLDSMSVAGPQIVDGRGAGRLADLLVELASGLAA